MLHLTQPSYPTPPISAVCARALTLLVLLRARYAPLVVDRREREGYTAALDAANDGDLGDLVRFFARLEIAALQSTLTEPGRVHARDAASAIRAYAGRLRDLEKAAAAEKADAVQCSAHVRRRGQRRLGETLPGDPLLVSLGPVRARPPDPAAAQQHRRQPLLRPLAVSQQRRPGPDQVPDRFPGRRRDPDRRQS